jgi:Protein of unknown function (DUF2975)
MEEMGMDVQAERAVTAQREKTRNDLNIERLTKLLYNNFVLFYDNFVKLNRDFKMNVPNQTLARLERISRFGEWICLLGILLVGGYSVFLVAQPAEAVAVMQRGIPGIANLPSNNMLILAGLVALLPMLVFIYALWRAHRLFGLIGTGHFLSEKSQKLMVHLGRLAIILAVLGIASHTLVGLILTSANPPGQNILLIEIDSGSISSVIIAVLFFTFSLLMKETASIAEENKSFI